MVDFTVKERLFGRGNRSDTYCREGVDVENEFRITKQPLYPTATTKCISFSNSPQVLTGFILDFLFPKAEKLKS